MRIILVLCAEIFVSEIYATNPKTTEVTGVCVCGAQSIGKLHLKHETTVCPSRNCVSVSVGDSREDTVNCFCRNYFLLKKLFLYP